MKFIDLFAGMGGFRLGLESINGSKNRGSKSNTKELSEDREGLVSETREKIATTTRRPNEWPDSNTNKRAFTCVYSNEWDEYCAKIYEKNFGEVPDARDIRTVSTKEIPDHDLLCAGFPCQSFSIAGQRKGFRDTRGTLFFEICRVLKDKRPSYLLLENVKGLLSHQDGWTFATMLLSLDELGYDVEWQVLNSKHFGVPQNRERVFIVGHLRGTGGGKVFPIREGSEISTTSGRKGQVKDQLATAITQNLKRGVHSGGETLVYEGSIMQPQNQMRIKDGKTLSRNVPQGQRIYSDKGISQTLAENSGGLGGKTGLYRVSRDMQIRRLTPIECERLQGFPDNWTEGVSDTQRYKMLGNAVTVNVIQAIGKRLTCKTQSNLN